MSSHQRAVFVAISLVIGVVLLAACVSVITFGLLHVSAPSHLGMMRNG
jgi:hypothetical protein